MNYSEQFKHLSLARPITGQAYLPMTGGLWGLADTIHELPFFNQAHRLNWWILKEMGKAFKSLEFGDYVDCMPVYYDDLEADYEPFLIEWLFEQYAFDFIEEAKGKWYECDGTTLEQMKWGQWLAMRTIHKAVYNFLEGREG